MKKTSSTLFKSAFLFFLLFIFYGIGGNFVFSQYSSTMLSEEWVGSGGTGTMFNRSIVKAPFISYNVYVVGSTINGYNNSDILIQKFNRKGVLLWQQEYAGTAGQNDFSTEAYVDNSENISVTGSVVDTITQGNDLVVLKYNSNDLFSMEIHLS